MVDYLEISDHTLRSNLLLQIKCKNLKSPWPNNISWLLFSKSIFLNGEIPILNKVLFIKWIQFLISAFSIQKYRMSKFKNALTATLICSLSGWLHYYYFLLSIVIFFSFKLENWNAMHCYLCIKHREKILNSKIKLSCNKDTKDWHLSVYTYRLAKNHWMGQNLQNLQVLKIV